MGGFTGRIPALFFLIAGVATAALAEVPRVALSLSPTVKQYSLQEISFQIPATGNPYDPQELAVEGVFISPSGRKLTLPAFYWHKWDPFLNQPGRETAWKLRFTPTEPGIYSVGLFLSRGGPATQVAVSQFECIASYQQGFVRTSGKHFALSTGEEFFPIGVNRCWGEARQFDSYLADMQRIAACGANCLRVWLAPWWLQLEPKPAQYDQGVAARLDQIFAHAEALGLRVILCSEQHGNYEAQGGEVGQWGAHPYNEANGGPCRTPRDFFDDAEAARLFRNRLRYLVARWSYSPALMAWELFNEVELAPVESHPWQRGELFFRWHRQMAEFLRAIDPHGRLIATSSDVALQRRLLGQRLVDFVQLHIYEKDALPAKIHEVASALASELNAPVVVGEFGTKPPSIGPDEVTRGILAAAFSGAGCGALPWLQDTAQVEDCYRRVRAAGAFLSSTRWSREEFLSVIPTILRPVQEGEANKTSRETLEGLRAIAQVGKQEARALIYATAPPAGQALRRPVPVQLFIPGIQPAAYSVEFWNAAEGTVLYRRVMQPEADINRADRAEPIGLQIEMPFNGHDVAIRLSRLAADH